MQFFRADDQSRKHVSLAAAVPEVLGLQISGKANLGRHASIGTPCLDVANQK